MSMVTLSTKNKYRYYRTLDMLQASIVMAGGRKVSIDELEKWRFGELLAHILRNGITLKIDSESAEECVDDWRKRLMNMQQSYDNKNNDYIVETRYQDEWWKFASEFNTYDDAYMYIQKLLHGPLGTSCMYRIIDPYNNIHNISNKRHRV